MTFTKVVVLTLITIWPSDGVPPSAPDSILGELNEVKKTLATLSDDVSQFSGVYLTQFEGRMLTAVSLLSSVDSNVKHLQERAHVWDTFQLHVAAWNEQIHALDKKMDFLSRGQEMIIALDGKSNVLQNLELKLEQAVERLIKMDSKVSELSKSVHDNNKDVPLYGEFATRGVLSTLKNIERKLDRLNSAVHSKEGKQKHGDADLTKGNSSSMGNDELEAGTSLSNRCTIVDEMIRDILSKVDVIFDKVSQSDEPFEIDADSMGQNSTHVHEEQNYKLTPILWKCLSSHCKKVGQTVNSLNELLKNISILAFANTKLNSGVDDVLTMNHVMVTGQNTIQSRLDEIERIGANQNVLVKLIKEQLTGIEAMLPARLVNYSNQITTSPPPVAINCEEAIGCEDSALIGRTQVIKLRNETDTNMAGRDYYTRLCVNMWTVIQRRGPNAYHENFNRSWEDYKFGFGSLEHEFWFGNDYIHRLTTKTDMVLRVELEDFNGKHVWAEYSKFRVGDEASNYKLTVGGYSGNASDSLSSHSTVPFSSIDRNNDVAPLCCPCASAYGGGWWFYSCFESNLNGVYHDSPTDNDYYRGIIWEHWLGDYSLRSTVMKIKPVTYVVTPTVDVFATSTLVFDDP